MGSLTQINKTLADCPACGREIVATLSVQVELTGDPADDKTVPAEARVTGLRVNHDCIPKATR